MKRLGVATIGQSPRPDVTPELRRVLGGVEIHEAGALDGLTRREVEADGIRPGDELLVTAMRDGGEIHTTHRFVAPRLQRRIRDLEPSVDVILLLCTGAFPGIQSSRLLVAPNEIVWGTARAALQSGRLAVVYPGEEQVKTPAEKQGDLEIVYDAASPYGPREGLTRLAERLNERSPDLILLNCMGFSHEAKRMIQEATGRPVIQSSSLVARVLQELLE